MNVNFSRADSVSAPAIRDRSSTIPHGVADMQEAEVTRVRTLHGGWRWALMVATAATILLCINQQFSLRFFIDYTQLNTEYFYLADRADAAVHVPDLSGNGEGARSTAFLVRRRPVRR